MLCAVPQWARRAGVHRLRFCVGSARGGHPTQEALTPCMMHRMGRGTAGIQVSPGEAGKWSDTLVWTVEKSLLFVWAALRL